MKIDFVRTPYVEKVQTLINVQKEAATVVARIDLGAKNNESISSISVVCRDPEGKVVAEASKNAPFSEDLPSFSIGFVVPEPRLWWSWENGEQPMYSLSIKIDGEDSGEIFSFGIRSIERRGETWFLNGRRLFLRGTNIIPAQWLSAYTPEQIEEDVSLMVEAGINIVRVHAHVNRREFYQACDRAGLMVWQDFPLQWSYQPSPDFAAKAVDQISSMVALLRSHPSIVAWCCHNEPVGQEDTLDPLLMQAVLSEDSSRIVRSHSDFKEHPYHGWYYGKLAEYAALPGQPLITEFGAQALPSVETLREIFKPEDLWPPNWAKWAYHDFQYEQTFWIAGVEKGDSLEDFVRNSQQKQADIIRYASDAYRRARHAPIAGFFQFMFVDGWPSITWSVLDHRRRKKLGYEVLKEVCSPVYLSLRLKTSVIRAGTPLPVDLMLINDLHQSIEAEVFFRLLSPDHRCAAEWEKKSASVGADGAVDLTRDWTGVLLPAEDSHGEFLLEGVVRQGEDILSRVHLPLRLERLPEELIAYRSVEM